MRVGGQDSARPVRWPHAFVVAARRRFALLPPHVRAPALTYTPALVAYVAGLLVLSVTAVAFTVRPRGDPLTIAVAGTAILLMASCAINALTSLSSGWTATGCIHLSLTLAFGPIGAFVAALAETAGSAVRYRSGLLRAGFNVSTCFLADMAAYAVYGSLVSLLHPGIVGRSCAGVVAGGAQWVVNHGLIAIVLGLARPASRPLTSLRRALFSLPYNLGYGWTAAFAVVAVAGDHGFVGFTALLVPVVLLQVFLVILARRVHEHAEEERRYARDREALLQRAIDASEAERRRIARDLHDGVVQHLAAFALMLDGVAERVDRGEADADALLMEATGVITGVSRETRVAIEDLRTLILEIAPPSGRPGGLRAVLDQLVLGLRDGGVDVRLEVDGDDLIPTHLAQLTIRVAQEALRNVAQHAGATTVTVRCSVSVAEGLMLIVRDDGRGFSDDDVERSRSSGHVGTRLLTGLCEEEGGRLVITSEPGRGTHVEFRAPVEAALQPSPS